VIVGAGVFPSGATSATARAVEALGLDVITSLRRRGRELRGDQILRLATGDPVTDVVGDTPGVTTA
jgi:hypothetical protein